MNIYAKFFIVEKNGWKVYNTLRLDRFIVYKHTHTHRNAYTQLAHIERLHVFYQGRELLSGTKVARRLRGRPSYLNRIYGKHSALEATVAEKLCPATDE